MKAPELSPDIELAPFFTLNVGKTSIAELVSGSIASSFAVLPSQRNARPVLRAMPFSAAAGVPSSPLDHRECRNTPQGCLRYYFNNY
jgi:hypothetical protein